MKQENKLLKDQVVQLKSEFAIVDWYCTVMEHGNDTREIVKEFANLKQKLDSVEKDKEKLGETIRKL